MRLHSNLFVGLGCTPYFIGPVPWLPIQEEGILFLGQIKKTLQRPIPLKWLLRKALIPRLANPVLPLSQSPEPLVLLALRPAV